MCIICIIDIMSAICAQCVACMIWMTVIIHSVCIRGIVCAHGIICLIIHALNMASIICQVCVRVHITSQTMNVLHTRRQPHNLHNMYHLLQHLAEYCYYGLWLQGLSPGVWCGNGWCICAASRNSHCEGAAADPCYF